MEHKGNVLVIDDAPELSDHVARSLTQMGYEYLFVGSAEEADALMERGLFDAILYGHEFLFPSMLHLLGYLATE